MPIALRRALLFLWAASLPLHLLPWDLPVPRAGLGEWFFPCALAAAAPWLAPAKLRRALVVPLLFIVGFAPSVAFSIDPRASLVQLGVLVYVTSILLVALQAARHGFGVVVLTGFVCGVVLGCVLGWAVPAYDWVVPGWPRPRGLTASPNMLAIQASIAALAALVLRAHGAPSSRLRVVWLVAAIALLATVICTIGHVVFAALVAAAFALVRLTARPRLVAGGGFGNAARLPVAIGALASAVVLLVLSVRIRLLPTSIAPYFIDTRPTPYTAPHEIALSMFGSKPLAGVGLECFTKAWPAHDDGVRFTASFAGGQEHRLGTPLDPHSTWLGYLAEGGVFGAMVLAGLVVLALRGRTRVVEPTRLYLDVALVFVAATAVVADVLTSRELALVCGVLFGLSSAPASHPSAPPVSGRS